MTLKASSQSTTGLLGKMNAPADPGYLAGLYVVPKGIEFATDVLALTESEWLDLINSPDDVRMRVLPLQWDVVPEKGDDTYSTSGSGNVAFVTAGKVTYRYLVKVTPFVKSQLNTLNGTDWDLYMLTSEGFIKGTSIDEIKFQPFTLDNFRVEGEIPALPGEEEAIVPITFTMADSSEDDSRPSFIQPRLDGILTGGASSTWNPRDLKDPRAITGLVDTPTITGFNIFLERYDRSPFTGAIEEDIVIEDTTTGVLTVVTTLTEDSNIPGQYAALATIAVGTYYIGPAPVGTSGATQGEAGLRKDLIKVENVIS